MKTLLLTALLIIGFAPSLAAQVASTRGAVQVTARIERPARVSFSETVSVRNTAGRSLEVAAPLSVSGTGSVIAGVVIGEAGVADGARVRAVGTSGKIRSSESAVARYVVPDAATTVTYVLAADA